jgi:hypothetical protein
VSQIRDCIERFRRALIVAWPLAVETVSDLAPRDAGDSWLSSWKQGQWEFYVEMPLFWGSKHFLSPYDSGADLMGSSSRVSSPGENPTHEVHCELQPGAIDLLTNRPPADGASAMTFVRLAAFRNGWHVEEPPFDCVLLLSNGKELFVQREFIRWRVDQLE